MSTSRISAVTISSEIPHPIKVHLHPQPQDFFFLLGRHLTYICFLISGTSFTPEERIQKNLTGLIPHVMETSDTQVMRAMRMINSRSTGIDKYLYLSGLKATNTDLFYRLLIDNVEQLMPLVYTPTIGDVCLQYSTLYTRPEALYISIKQRKSIRTILRNWQYPDPAICVVTDGSRILGLGDLGVNGVGISVSEN
jgi:malate dehydrogenase (oxaloacetate-decarboxylating)(NADP+)